MSEETTAVAKVEEKQNSISTARNLNELPIAETAKALMSSGLIRSGEDLGKVFAKLSLGRDLGLPAVSSLNGIGITPQGTIILSAALMRLLINKSGRYKLHVKQRDLKGASIEVFERQVDGTWQSMGVPIFFGPDDAKRAGLDRKDTYLKWPVDMYYARCLAAAFRTYTPDCAGGCAVYIPEEIDGSGYKTDPVSGDAIPEADFEVKKPAAKAAKKVAATSDNLDAIRKLMKDTNSQERTFCDYYKVENLTDLNADQQFDLQQKLTQKKVAAV